MIFNFLEHISLLIEEGHTKPEAIALAKEELATRKAYLTSPQRIKARNTAKIKEIVHNRAKHASFNYTE